MHPHHPSSPRLDLPIHSGSSLYYTGYIIGLSILVVTLPLAIYMTWRLALNRLGATLHPDHLEVRGIFRTRRYPLSDVMNVGMSKTPIVARGLPGYLQRQRARDVVELDLNLVDRRHKIRKVNLSELEGWPALYRAVDAAVEARRAPLAA